MSLHRTRIFIFTFICIPAIGFTQRQTQLDSLLIVLQHIDIKYSKEAVALRNKIGRLYKQRNLKQAMVFAEETVAFAEKVNSPNELTNAYALVADLANLMGDFKKGALFGEKTASSMKDLNDSLSLAKKNIVMMNKGGWISPVVSPEEKIGYGNKALEIYTLLGNEAGIANACSELGNAHKNKALYQSKGNARDDSTDFKKARYYFNRAQNYNRKLNNKLQLAYCLTLEAMMERQLGFTAKAYRLNKMAIAIYEQEGCLLGTALPYAEVSDLFYSSRRFDSALFYIDKSIAFYEAVGYKGNIDEYYDRKSKIFEAQHDYRNALVFDKIARQEREKKYSGETTKSIIEIENKYENKLKEEQIRTLSAEKLLTEKKINQDKIIFWGILLILTVSIIGLIVYLIQRQKILDQLQSNAKLDKAITRTLENQLRQVQLQALQGQMNPHFIYNALSSIQNLILKEDKEHAITYLNDFAQLSRLTLENSLKEKIKLKDELKFLQRYLDLESLRIQSSFTYTITVDQSIDTEVETIPPMVVQPIIENAIKHGLKPKETGGQLTIHFKIGREDDDLICVVDDNGVGRAQSVKNQLSYSHHSISTEANEARLKLISESENLKNKYRIDIQDKYDDQHHSTGTRVEIYFAQAKIKNVEL